MTTKCGPGPGEAGAAVGCWLLAVLAPHCPRCSPEGGAMGWFWGFWAAGTAACPWLPGQWTS